MRDGPLLAMGMAALLALSALAGASVPAAAELAPTALPARPARIASTSLSSDEILLDLIAPTRIVATSAFAIDPLVSNVPEAAARVGHALGADAETLLALEPDLVITGPFVRPETRALLSLSGIALFEMEAANSLLGVERNVSRLGQLVGEEARAAALVRAMWATVERVRRDVQGRPAPRVLLFDHGGYTAGSDTLFDDLVRAAGGRNAAAEDGIVGHSVLSVERALSMDADVVLINDYRADARQREILRAPDLARDPVWRATRAVQEGRAYVMDPRHLLSTSHHAAAAVVDIARHLHGDTVTR